MRDDALKLLVSFRRWKYGDESVRMHQYRLYADWLQNAAPGRGLLQGAPQPMEHVYSELGQSHAGWNLTAAQYIDTDTSAAAVETEAEAAGVDSSFLSSTVTGRKRPAQRLLVIQKQLESRFLAATESTTEGFFGKASAARPVSSFTGTAASVGESKHTEEEIRPALQTLYKSRKAQQQTAEHTARARQQQHYRGYVQELFAASPLPTATTKTHTSSPAVMPARPLTGITAATSTTPAAGASIRATVAAAVRSPNTTIRKSVTDTIATPTNQRTAAPSTYIPAARLFSPTLHSPYPSAQQAAVTPFQPSRRPAAADLSAVATRGKQLHVKELM